jgi:thiol-disulfide isomerase/thioredoxin
MLVDVPTIKAGISKITGTIKSPNHTNKDSIFVTIGVPHPISGEYVKYHAFVDRSGNFSIDVNVETKFSLIALSSSLNPYKSFFVKLASGGVTNIDVAYNAHFDIEKIQVTPTGMTQNDMTRGVEVISEMVAYRPDRAPQPLYAKSIDYFLNYAKNVVLERLQILNNDTLISKELKGVVSKDFRLLIYNAHVFDYKGEMILNYQNINADISTKPDIQNIDKSYFRFLKEFKLNDLQYLYCSTFPEFQKTILQNEKLGLSVIGERDIPSWLASVKVILSDLVGFEDGQYYDILAANAYARQLNEEVKPLTKKQKANIVSYWKNGEIAKILFRKNQQVVELEKVKSPAVINAISSVPDDKVIETIVSKHKNKVVFVDFWATWCAPCLDAMQRFKSTKNGFLHKDVVFVYLTNSSSPLKLWEEKIKGIGDEHYYLSDSQWEYIMNHNGFEAIPSYLLFNKDGALINKFTAFPENNKVKEMINGLL